MSAKDREVEEEMQKQEVQRECDALVDHLDARSCSQYTDMLAMFSIMSSLAMENVYVAKFLRAMCVCQIDLIDKDGKGIH